MILKGCEICEFISWDILGKLIRLSNLDLSYCRKLCGFPESINSKVLKTFYLQGCRNLMTMLWIESTSLVTLYLSSTPIAGMPSSIGYINTISNLILSHCNKSWVSPNAYLNCTSWKPLICVAAKASTSFQIFQYTSWSCLLRVRRWKKFLRHRSRITLVFVKSRFSVAKSRRACQRAYLIWRLSSLSVWAKVVHWWTFQRSQKQTLSWKRLLRTKHHMISVVDWESNKSRHERLSKPRVCGQLVWFSVDTSWP